MGAERGGSGPGKLVIRDSVCGRFERVLRGRRLETILFIEIRFRGFTAYNVDTDNNKVNIIWVLLLLVVDSGWCAAFGQLP